MATLDSLLTEVSRCRLCAAHLPLGPRPVLQCAASARILIAGQAPGRRVHATGIPFDDASGARLREWMGIEPEVFYDPARVAILPMGFCYPGSGSSGDLPPRPECADKWRQPLLEKMPGIELILVLGAYAQDYHLAAPRGTVTERVRGWRDCWPGVLPLPHPSPRNNRWLKQNPWFGDELLPALQTRVKQIFEGPQDE